MGERCAQNLELVRRLRIQHTEHKSRYGARRHAAGLTKIDRPVSRKRVRRLMRLEGIVAKQRRRFKVTTVSDHDNPVAANLLDRQFNPTRPNQAWVGDITYLPTTEGFLYLAIVMDLFSRRVIGWSISERMTRGLVIDAFKLALGRRGCAPDTLFHSDRGSQYASFDYRKILKTCGITASMSRRANCWDNAVAESFFATLEKELHKDLGPQKRETVRLETIAYIEGYYNRKRLHSTLGYMTPLEREESWALA